jgi:hypothetical protein
MSAISLRLPDSLHKGVRTLAVKEGVSINQVITLAVAEKISALLAEDYIEARATRGSKAKFLKAMSKVSKDAPAAQDRL